MGKRKDRKVQEWQQRQHQSVQLFASELEPGEQVIDVGLANWLQLAHLTGKRGGGEGLLLLTDQGVLFRSDHLTKPIVTFDGYARQFTRWSWDDFVDVTIRKVTGPLYMVRCPWARPELEFHMAGLFAQVVVETASNWRPHPDHPVWTEWLGEDAWRAERERFAREKADESD